ncbi:MAG: hypothetical protein QW429_06835 [Thermoprotei archaeon]
MSVRSRLGNLQEAILRLDGARYLFTTNLAVARFLLGAAATSLAAARRDLADTPYAQRIAEEQGVLGNLISRTEDLALSALLHGPYDATTARVVLDELNNLIKRLITVLQEAYAGAPPRGGPRSTEATP